MECPECKSKMKVKKEKMTTKTNPKIIVESIKVNKCCKCNFSSISENEYERIRKKVEKIKVPQEATVIL